MYLEPNPYILLIKTDPIISQRTSLDLKDTGYTTIVETDPTKGLDRVLALQPAMIVLDRKASGELGLVFCQKLRLKGDRLPILMLLEEDTVEERIICLEAGADDYLLKPYHSQKFLELVNLYLKPQGQPPEQLRFGDLILDLTARQALRKGQKMGLTMKEFELLKYLMSHPQQVLTREQILENVWGYDFRGESNVIEVYIRYLRLKLEQESNKRLIQTVRGVGYVLRES
jgi:two-component system, OmpR family, response regulator NblR